MYMYMYISTLVNSQKRSTVVFIFNPYQNPLRLVQKIWIKGSSAPCGAAPLEYRCKALEAAHRAQGTAPNMSGVENNVG